MVGDLSLNNTFLCQVIEISSIPEHLLDECQNRENYIECDISLLAIRVEDLSKWQRSKLCKPPGEGEQINWGI